MTKDRKVTSIGCQGTGIVDDTVKPVQTCELYVDSVAAEVEELQRRGLLDDAAVKRIEGRVQKDLERIKQEHDQQIASIKVRYVPESPVLPLKYRVPIWLVLLFVLGSIPLHLTVGEGFIFVHANEYRSALPWLTLAFALPLGGVFLRNDKLSGVLLRRFPTPLIRWFLVFPVFIGLYSFAIAIAPLGWLALYGWAFGKKVDSMGATVAYIGPYRHGRGCKQTAILDIESESAGICLDHRLSGEVPKSGEFVLISGNISPMGIYISEVSRDTQHAPRP